MSKVISFDAAVAHCNGLGERRVLIGIAGPPGSGKSTIAEKLEAALPSAAILPMDGFHYDDVLLEKLGRKHRKGAPDTFDVGGFKHLLQRFKANLEDAIAVPVFDRSIEIARAGGRLISRDVKVIIVEGNYLFLKQQPWAELFDVFDATIMVETPLDVLRKRLTARWQSYDIAPDEITRRVEENDLVNARFVMAESRAAEFILKN